MPKSQDPQLRELLILSNLQLRHTFVLNQH